MSGAPHAAPPAGNQRQQRQAARSDGSVNQNSVASARPAQRNVTTNCGATWAAQGGWPFKEMQSAMPHQRPPPSDFLSRGDTQGHRYVSIFRLRSSLPLLSYLTALEGNLHHFDVEAEHFARYGIFVKGRTSKRFTDNYISVYFRSIFDQILIFFMVVIKQKRVDNNFLKMRCSVIGFDSLNNFMEYGVSF